MGLEDNAERALRQQEAEAAKARLKSEAATAATKASRYDELLKQMLRTYELPS
jgi:hypothetical protein